MCVCVYFIFLVIGKLFSILSYVLFFLIEFQKRVLQLLLDIRKTVSDTSTCGGKPADTACTLTIKRNNSLEEVQNLEDELVNPVISWKCATSASA